MAFELHFVHLGLVDLNICHKEVTELYLEDEKKLDKIEKLKTGRK